MDFLLNPNKFFAERGEMSFKIPLLVVTVCALVGALSTYISMPYLLPFIENSLVKSLQLPKETIKIVSQTILFSAVIFSFIGAFLGWVLFTAILFGLSAIFRGKGSFTTLMKFMAFSLIPPIILSPVNTYLLIEFFRTLSNEALISIVLFGFASTLWQFVYWVYAVKNARKLSLKNSVLICSVILVISFAMSVNSTLSQVASFR
ncbi:MAG: YIP1 family protein [Archaeoglobaceae archaeon]